MEMRPSDRDHMTWLDDIGLSDIQGQSVLDLGCGSGYLCHWALDNGATRAVGIDVVKPENWSDGSSWDFQAIDLEDQHWSDLVSQGRGGFSRILAFDILEHLTSPWNFLQNCRVLLSEGGVLVLTTPNTSSWERRKNPASWSGATDRQHKTLFTPYSLRFMLERCGYQQVETGAPVRKLRFLGNWVPKIGGQIICRAS